MAPRRGPPARRGRRLRPRRAASGAGPRGHRARRAEGRQRRDRRQLRRRRRQEVASMSMNEADTRYHLIDPVLRAKGYVSRDQVTLETILTPPPVEPIGSKGRRRKGPGRTDYLLCVQVANMPKSMPIAVLEAKREGYDPLKGMQQAKAYADCERFEVKYVRSEERRVGKEGVHTCRSRCRPSN